MDGRDLPGELLPVRKENEPHLLHSNWQRQIVPMVFSIGYRLETSEQFRSHLYPSPSWDNPDSQESATPQGESHGWAVPPRLPVQCSLGRKDLQKYIDNRFSHRSQ